MKPTLFLSSRITSDTKRMWQAAVQAGWHVERLMSWRVPEDAPRVDVAIYGEALFAEAVAGQLRLALLEPPLDFLTHLSQDLLQRRVEATTLAEARLRPLPFFLKPADGKKFEARVYTSADALPSPDQLDSDTPVLLSEPVRFALEVRCFVREARVYTSSAYARQGAAIEADPSLDATEEELAAAHSFAALVLQRVAHVLPPSVVLDVGLLADGRWAVVEANPSYASGLYSADPLAALECIRRAVVPVEELTLTHDPFFLRRPDPAA